MAETSVPYRPLYLLLEALRDATPPQPGLAYRGAADFVLRHGAWFGPRPWDPAWPRGLPLHCFGNAISRAALHGWRYVEGFALSPGPERAILHAWNLDEDGLLIDTTWRNRGLAYVGVLFSLGRADDATWNGDGCVLDDPHRGHPLFREEWRGEDFGLPWEPSPALQLLPGFPHPRGALP